VTAEQKQTIKSIIENLKIDENVIGIILCGSLAKGNSTKNSDVDILIVVNDTEFKKIKDQKKYFWTTDQNIKKYPCEVDGKIINIDFLTKSLTNGNEPTKNTLKYSKLIYCNSDKLTQVFEKLATLNIVDKNENIKKYYALMKSSRYSADDHLKNRYQVIKCMLDTVLYASRLVLSHNNRLFPCEKNMGKEIINCENKPENYIHLMHRLLDDLSFENLESFYDVVELYFEKYKFNDTERKGYVIENENFWFFDIFPFDKI
jgi:hypothetical protein